MARIDAKGAGTWACLALAALTLLGCSPDREFETPGAAGAAGDPSSSGGAGTGGTDSGGTSAMAGDSSLGDAGATAGDGGTAGTSQADPCADDPCINGGVCSAEGNEAVCTCSAAYEGDHCELSVDDCAENPCQNGGTCVDGTDAYTCSCAKGFSGVNCERAVSKCEDSPCLNGATCMDDAGSYKCTCKNGFGGTNCELNIDDCAANPCKNGASCKDGVATYTCECKSGYTGTNCDVNVDECKPNPCQNGATCVDGNNMYTCQCKAGFEGTNCQTNIDECKSNPCQNGGSCVDGDNAYTCTCATRYTGTNCEYLEVKVAPNNLGGTGYATKGMDLSNDGKVLLLYYTNSTATDHGMGRLVDFDAANTISLLSPWSQASGYGIDKDGTTIVGSAQSSDDNVFYSIKRVGNATTAYDLSTVDYFGAGSYASAVNADGTAATGKVLPGSSIVGGWFCKNGSACQTISVDGPSWRQIHPLSISGDGTVVVGYTVPLDLSETGSAWRWATSAAKGTLLSSNTGGAAWTASAANGISRDGKVVVGSATINGVSHAVRWSGASLTPTDLGTGRATATSADGSVTVGVDNSNVPLVWFGTTRKTLASVLSTNGTNPDLNSTTLTELVAVSDDGKVVGGTLKISNLEHAFMARLP